MTVQNESIWTGISGWSAQLGLEVKQKCFKNFGFKHWWVRNSELPTSKALCADFPIELGPQSTITCKEKGLGHFSQKLIVDVGDEFWWINILVTSLSPYWFSHQHLLTVTILKSPRSSPTLLSRRNIDTNGFRCQRHKLIWPLKASFQECQITCGSNTVKMKCKKATGKWKPSYKRFDFTKC